MMRLSVINASPRGTSGNTNLILKHFLDGVESGGVHQIETCLISSIDSDEQALRPFSDAEVVMLAFPLYVYSLPAAATRWVARLARHAAELRTLAAKRPIRMAFLVQYGFREACHARDCERQLKRLCQNLGFGYAGTVIRGGSEGIRAWPSRVQAQFFGAFRTLGIHFGQADGQFDQAELDRFSAPELASDSWRSRLGTRMFAAIANALFWKPQLKKHGALARDADQPLLWTREKRETDACGEGFPANALNPRLLAGFVCLCPYHHV